MATIEEIAAERDALKARLAELDAAMRAILAQQKMAEQMTNQQRAALALISDGRPHGYGYDDGLGWVRIALRQLAKHDFVTIHGKGSGASETYSITDAGREVVDGWKRAAAHSQG